MGLVGVVEQHVQHLYSFIWKDFYPKKIILFLRELSLGVVNTVDRLQRCVPYISFAFLVYYLSV